MNEMQPQTFVLENTRELSTRILNSKRYVKTKRWKMHMLFEMVWISTWGWKNEMNHVINALAIWNGVSSISECMGKTFQAATTNTWEVSDHRSLLQNIVYI